MVEGSAMIIENYDGRFLLHLRDEHAPLMKNEWCLVGGTIEEGERPEKIVTTDRPLIVTIILWGLMVIGLIYVF